MILTEAGGPVDGCVSDKISRNPTIAKSYTVKMLLTG